MLKIPFFARRRLVPLLQVASTDCAAACLAMVLRYYGRRVEIAELHDTLGLDRGGGSALSIVQTATAFGLTARGVGIQRENIEQLTTPAIIHWHDRHFVVLERWCLNPTIVDPASGRRRVTHTEFWSGASGIAIELRAATPNPPRTRQPLLFSHRLGFLLRVIRREGVWLLVTTLLLSVSWLVFFWLAARLLDSPATDGVSRYLVTALLACVLVGTIAVLLRGVARTKFQAHLRVAYAGDVTKSLLSLPLPFFQRRASYDVASRVSDIDASSELITTIFVCALDFIVGVTCFVSLFVYLPGVALIVSFVAGTDAWLATRRAHLTSKLAQSRRAGEAREYLQRSLRSMWSIKAAATEEVVAGQWHAFLDQLRSNARDLERQLSIVDGIYWLVSWLGTTILLAATMALVAFGHVSRGRAVLAAAGVAFVLLSSRRFVSALRWRGQLREHLRRTDDVLSAGGTASKGESASIEAGVLELRQVSYRYGAHGAFILKDIDLVCRPGEIIGITGPTGSGKSTLAHLLAGLIVPTAGRVLYGHVDARLIDRQLFGVRVGVMLQNATMFDATILDNVRAGRLGLDYEDVVLACERVGIASAIAAMPMRYDTPVRDFGRNLSEGERQLLLVARAIAGHPRVLILDEPVSALDARCESRALQGIAAVGATCVLLSARPATLVYTHRIVRLHQGCIINEPAARARP